MLQKLTSKTVILISAVHAGRIALLCAGFLFQREGGRTACLPRGGGGDLDSGDSEVWNLKADSNGWHSPLLLIFCCYRRKAKFASQKKLLPTRKVFDLPDQRLFFWNIRCTPLHEKILRTNAHHRLGRSPREYLKTMSNHSLAKPEACCPETRTDDII